MERAVDTGLFFLGGATVKLGAKLLSVGPKFGGRILNIQGVGNLDLTKRGVNNIILRNATRIADKLGDKIGGLDLPFSKSKAGFDDAVRAVRATLENPTNVYGAFTSKRGKQTVIDVFSKETGFTVRLRSDGTFETLIKGATSKVIQ